MLEFDKKSNLLMTNRYQYSLQMMSQSRTFIANCTTMNPSRRSLSTCAMCRKTCRTKSG